MDILYSLIRQKGDLQDRPSIDCHIWKKKGLRTQTGGRETGNGKRPGPTKQFLPLGDEKASRVKG
jgi:hypothetical protein